MSKWVMDRGDAVRTDHLVSLSFALGFLIAAVIAGVDRWIGLIVWVPR